MKHFHSYILGEVKFKNVLWYLNEKDDDKNKLIFDKRLSNFSFDDFSNITTQNFFNLFGELN